MTTLRHKNMHNNTFFNGVVMTITNNMRTISDAVKFWHDCWTDGKFTFEEFLEAFKDYWHERVSLDKMWEDATSYYIYDDGGHFHLCRWGVRHTIVVDQVAYVCAVDNICWISRSGNFMGEEVELPYFSMKGGEQ